MILFFRYRVLCPQRNYTRPTELSSVKYPLILNMWKKAKKHLSRNEWHIDFWVGYWIMSVFCSPKLKFNLYADVAHRNRPVKFALLPSLRRQQRKFRRAPWQTRASEEDISTKEWAIFVLPKSSPVNLCPIDRMAKVWIWSALRWIFDYIVNFHVPIGTRGVPIGTQKT